jgi:hypothetical protein
MFDVDHFLLINSLVSRAVGGKKPGKKPGREKSPGQAHFRTLPCESFAAAAGHTSALCSAKVLRPGGLFHFALRKSGRATLSDFALRKSPGRRAFCGVFRRIGPQGGSQSLRVPGGDRAGGTNEKSQVQTGY